MKKLILVSLIIIGCQNNLPNPSDISMFELPSNEVLERWSKKLIQFGGMIIYLVYLLRIMYLMKKISMKNMDMDFHFQRSFSVYRKPFTKKKG